MTKSKERRPFENLSGPEKALMRKMARCHWTEEELSRYFRADIEAVKKVIQNVIDKKRKTEPKTLNNIKDYTLHVGRRYR
jgi:hypothetical protein